MWPSMKQDAAAMKASKNKPMSPQGQDPYLSDDGEDGMIL